MAWSLVQAAQNAAGAGTCTATFSNTPVPGDLVVLTCWSNHSTAFTTIEDGNGVAVPQVSGAIISGSGHTQQFCCYIVPATPSKSFTVSLASATYATLDIYEFKGAPATLAAAIAVIEVSTYQLTGLSLDYTPSANAELVVSFCAVNAGTGISSPSWSGSSPTLTMGSENLSSSDIVQFEGYILSSGSSSSVAQANWSGGSRGGLIVVTFNQGVGPSVAAVPRLVEFVPGASITTTTPSTPTVAPSYVEFIAGQSSVTIAGSGTAAAQANPTYLELLAGRATTRIAGPIQIASPVAEFIPGTATSTIGGVDSPVDPLATAQTNQLLQYLRSLSDAGTEMLSGDLVGCISSIGATYRSEFEQYKATTTYIPAIMGFFDGPVPDTAGDVYIQTGTYNANGVPNYTWTTVAPLAISHGQAGGVITFVAMPSCPDPLRESGGKLASYGTELTTNGINNALALQWGPAAAAEIGVGTSVSQTQDNINLNQLLDHYAKFAGILAGYGIPILFRLWPENNGPKSSFWWAKLPWSNQLFKYTLGYLSGNGGYSGQPTTATPVHNLLYVYCQSVAGGLDSSFAPDYRTIDIYGIDRYHPLSSTNKTLESGLNTVGSAPGYSNKVPAITEIGVQGNGVAAAGLIQYASEGVDVSSWTSASTGTFSIYQFNSGFPAANGTIAIPTSKGIVEVAYASFDGVSIFSGCVAPAGTAPGSDIIYPAAAVQVVPYTTGDAGDNAGLLGALGLTNAAYFHAWFSDDNILFQAKLTTLYSDPSILKLNGDGSNYLLPYGYVACVGAMPVVEYLPAKGVTVTVT